MAVALKMKDVEESSKKYGLEQIPSQNSCLKGMRKHHIQFLSCLPWKQYFVLSKMCVFCKNKLVKLI